MKETIITLGLLIGLSLAAFSQTGIIKSVNYETGVASVIEAETGVEGKILLQNHHIMVVPGEHVDLMLFGNAIMAVNKRGDKLGLVSQQRTGIVVMNGGSQCLK